VRGYIAHLYDDAERIPQRRLLGETGAHVAQVREVGGHRRVDPEIVEKQPQLLLGGQLGAVMK